MLGEHLVLHGVEPHAAVAQGQGQHEAPGARELLVAQGADEALGADVAGDLGKAELVEKRVLGKDEVHHALVGRLAGSGKTRRDAQALGEQARLADLGLDGKTGVGGVLLGQAGGQGTGERLAVEHALAHGEGRGGGHARAGLRDVEDLVDERLGVAGHDALGTQREVGEVGLPRRHGAGHHHGVGHERGGVVGAREKVGVADGVAQVATGEQHLRGRVGVDGARRHGDVDHAVEGGGHGHDRGAGLPGGAHEDRERQNVGVADGDDRVVSREPRGSQLVVDVARLGETAGGAAGGDAGAREVRKALVNEAAADVLEKGLAHVVAAQHEHGAGLAGDGLGGLAHLVDDAGAHAQVAGAGAQHDGLATDGHHGLGLGLGGGVIGLGGRLSSLGSCTRSLIGGRGSLGLGGVGGFDNGTRYLGLIDDGLALGVLPRGLGGLRLELACGDGLFAHSSPLSQRRPPVS